MNPPKDIDEVIERLDKLGLFKVTLTRATGYQRPPLDFCRWLEDKIVSPLASINSTDYWFEKEEEAILFDAIWNYGLGNFEFNFVIIDVPDTEENVKQLENFGVSLAAGSCSKFGTMGFDSEDDAMYAKLIFPDAKFFDLRNLDLNIDEYSDNGVFSKK